MIRTVNAVAAARKTARYVCSPRFLNASSGPYADEYSPSAPSPTQATNAMSEMWRKRCGSCRSLGPPRRNRFSLCAGLRRCSGGTDSAGVLIEKLGSKARATFPVEPHLAPCGGYPSRYCMMQCWTTHFLAFRKRRPCRREHAVPGTTPAGREPDAGRIAGGSGRTTPGPGVPRRATALGALSRAAKPPGASARALGALVLGADAGASAHADRSRV